MIIHSIVDAEYIYSNMNNEAYPLTRIIEFDGIKIEVSFSPNNNYLIHRIFTTDLNDYLNPQLQPGKILEAYYKPKDG